MERSDLLPGRNLKWIWFDMVIRFVGKDLRGDSSAIVNELIHQICTKFLLATKLYQLVYQRMHQKSIDDMGFAKILSVRIAIDLTDSWHMRVAADGDKDFYRHLR